VAAALSDPRFKLETGDGRRWINQAARTGSTERDAWDLIAVLVPDPTTAMINRYYTREFHTACRALLSPGGVLFCRVTASANYLEDETGALAKTVYGALGASFHTVSAGGGDRLLLAASDQPATDLLSADRLVRHYEESGTIDPGFSPFVFHTQVEDQRNRFIEMKLRQPLPDRIEALNSDWRPLAQAHTIRLWSRFSGEAVDQAFQWLFRPLPTWPAAAGLFILISWALWPLAKRQGAAATGRNHGSVLPAVAVAGFAGLGLELICLHLYQGAFGTLYRMIGSVVALFMLGLALGGATATPLHRRLASDSLAGQRRVLALGLSGQALSALAAPALLLLVTGNDPLFTLHGVPQALVMLLVAIVGWFTGLALPAAGGALDRVNTDNGAATTGRASALVNAADHLGAAAAAALVGLVALPRFGVPAISWMLALLTSCSAARIWLESRGQGQG